jgi:hypothetical protein
MFWCDRAIEFPELPLLDRLWIDTLLVCSSVPTEARLFIVLSGVVRSAQLSFEILDAEKVSFQPFRQSSGDPILCDAERF